MNLPSDLNALTEKIIGAAIEVHKALGPGLLESPYETCLAKEFELQGIPFERQVDLPMFYKGIPVNAGYRIDLWVNRTIILELKAVESILPIHRAQLLTYLRLTRCPLGLILNFNVEVMRYGVKRVILTP
jgi:GxxExxY protein